MRREVATLMPAIHAMHSNLLGCEAKQLAILSMFLSCLPEDAPRVNWLSYSKWLHFHLSVAAAIFFYAMEHRVFINKGRKRERQSQTPYGLCPHIFYNIKPVYTL